MKKTLLCGALAILLCGFAAAQQFTVIHNFGNTLSDDGDEPQGNPIIDSQGNLYGVTAEGGTSTACSALKCGTIYELSPNGNGDWSETTLYDFCSQEACSDGAIPANGLIADSAGNFYGTTSAGGNACSMNTLGCGVVFKFSPPSSSGGSWTYTVLYKFCSVLNCADGAVPGGPLAMDSAGALYGTTMYGGTNTAAGGGTVFKLSFDSGGVQETVLYAFCSESNGTSCIDGAAPSTGVTLGKSGALYGTTTAGGSSNNGILYKVTNGSGSITLTTLYTFEKYKAYSPGAPVSLDSNENAYTTFAEGGTGATGGILKVASDGTPSFFYFGEQSNGRIPYTGIIIKEPNNIAYGLTSAGGTGNDGGILYSIDRRSRETVLHSFCQQILCHDGEAPNGLLVATSGVLYGTTVIGGTGDTGTVFEFIP